MARSQHSDRVAREGCARLCRHCQQLGTAPAPNHQDNTGFVQISPLKQGVRGVLTCLFPAKAAQPSFLPFRSCSPPQREQISTRSSAAARGRDRVVVVTQNWAWEVGGQRQVGSAGGLWLPTGALPGEGHSQGKQRVCLVVLGFLSTALSWNCCGSAGIPPQPAGCITPSLYGKLRTRAKQEGLVTPSLCSSSTC